MDAIQRNRLETYGVHALFFGIWYLAGNTRFIKYFPSSSKEKLLHYTVSASVITTISKKCIGPLETHPLEMTASLSCVFIIWYNLASTMLSGFYMEAFKISKRPFGLNWRSSLQFTFLQVGGYISLVLLINNQKIQHEENKRREESESFRIQVQRTIDHGQRIIDLQQKIIQRKVVHAFRINADSRRLERLKDAYPPKI